MLRPAMDSDAKAIRAIIRQVQINPNDLDWRRFLVAEDSQGRVIGCGQLKSHRDGSQELASIAVLPEWRNRGIARAVIQNLIASHFKTQGEAPLYLMCGASLGNFYRKFGFQPVLVAEMPPYFRRFYHLVQAFWHQYDGGAGLLVMKCDSSHTPPAPQSSGWD